MYDAKCGRPQRGVGGWSNADTCGQGEGGYEKGSFFADVLYGRPPRYLVHSVFMHEVTYELTRGLSGAI